MKWIVGAIPQELVVDAIERIGRRSRSSGELAAIGRVKGVCKSMSGAVPSPNPGSQSQLLGDSLQDYLRRASAAIQATEFSQRLLRGAIAGLLSLMALILIDHWVWPLPTAARLVAFLLLATGFLWWLLRRILPLAFRRIHPEYAARQIEQAMPELKNSLINWLQLSKDGTPPPKGILATVARYAAGRLRGHEAQSVVDASTPIKLAAILFGALVVFGIYLAIAPKSGFDTMRRLLFPLADIQAPTRVRILQVEPGDSKVTQGSVLEIKAQVRGLQAIDTVQVRYETTDGQLVDQQIPMEAETEGLFYRLRLGSGSNGIHQDLRYWVEAGDAVAGPYSVTIQPIPLVAIDRVEYVYPSYTRLAPRVVPGDGRIEAIEGTRVTIHGRSNQPLQKARVEIDPVMEQGEFVRASTIYDVRIEDVGMVCDWLLQLDSQRASPTLSSYRIKATNPLGESNLNPVIYPIKVLGDIPPEAIWRIDSRKPIQLPVNQTLELPLRATDPDFGLHKVAIEGKVGQRLRIEQTLLESAEPLVGPQEKTWQLNPGDWQLKAGDRLELSMIATDHRTKPGTEEPQPNVGQSLPLVIEIVDPNDAGSKKPEDENRPGDRDPANPNGDPKQDPKENPNGKQGAKDPRKPAPENGTQNPKDSNGSEDPNDPSKGENPSNSSKESPSNSSGKGKDQRPDGKEKKEQEKSSQSEGDSGGGAGGEDSSDSSSDRSDSSEGSDNQPGGSGKSSKPSKGRDDRGDSQQDPGDASEEGSEGSGQMNDGQSSDSGTSSPGGQSTEGSSSDNQNGDAQGTQSGSQSKGSDRPGENRSGAGGNEQIGSPDSASEGESSENSAPEHDGEVFERIQKYLQEKGKSQPGDSSQSKGTDHASGLSDPSQTTGDPSTKPEEGTDPGNEGQPDRQGNRSPGTGSGQSSKEQAGDRSDQSPANDPSSPSMKEDAASEDTKEQGEPGKTEQAGGKQGNSSGKENANPPSQSKSGNPNETAESKSPNSTSSNEEGMKNGKSDPESSPDHPTSEKSGDGERSSQSGGNQGGGENGSKSSDGEASSGSDGSKQGSEGSKGSSEGSKGSSEGSKGSSEGSKGSSEGSKGSSEGSKGSSEGSKGSSGGSKGKQEGAGESGGASSDSQGAKEEGASEGSTEASKKDGQTEGSATVDSAGNPASSGDPASEKTNPSETKDPSDPMTEEGKGGEQGAKSSESSGSEGSSSGKQAGSEGSQEAAGAAGAKGGDGATGGGQKTGPAGASASGRSRGNASGQGAPGRVEAGGGKSGEPADPDGGQAENLEDPANLEYAKKATDMALEALRRQREQPDPELLKKLHWSEQDLRKFLDRWESAREQAMSDPEQQKKFEKELQALGLVPRRGDARQVDRRLDQLRGMRESGVRMPAPENLRRQFDQYRRSLANPPPSGGK
jgi:collagen type III alpha